MHLEADTGRGIAVVDQHAIAQDPMDEIDRGAIEYQKINRSGQALFEPVTERLSGNMAWQKSRFMRE